MSSQPYLGYRKSIYDCNLTKYVTYEHKLAIIPPYSRAQSGSRLKKNTPSGAAKAETSRRLKYSAQAPLSRYHRIFDCLP